MLKLKQVTICSQVYFCSHKLYIVLYYNSLNYLKARFIFFSNDLQNEDIFYFYEHKALKRHYKVYFASFFRFQETAMARLL